jgi:hypothetical protein
MVRANGIGGREEVHTGFLVGKRGRKGTLGRPRCRLEDYIKMDLCVVEWGGGMDWDDLAQDRDR